MKILDEVEIRQLEGREVHVESTNGWTFDGPVTCHAYLKHGFAVAGKYVDARLVQVLYPT